METLISGITGVMEVMKSAVKRLIRDEKGQTLIMALILLAVGGLIITSLLGLMSTGLLTGQVYEDTMHVLYAADAGVEDGLWQIKNDQLSILFPNPPPPDGDGYDEYAYFDYDPSYKWEYYLAGGVNDKAVNVTIENVWVPKDIPAPDPGTARQTIEEGELIISGSPSFAGGSQYEIKISYNKSCGDLVNTIGIWLPPGFEYDGNYSLEDEGYYPELQIDAYKGGYAVVWAFGSGVSLSAFPTSFTFQYSGPEGQSPGAAVSWIVTTGGYAWDADVKIYKISSTATDPDTGKQTTVEAYTTKIEMRELGSAISGDYVSIGNSLMTGNPDYHNQLLKESDATIQDSDPLGAGYIPEGATVEGAYLYWSGWIDRYYWKATASHGHTTWSWVPSTDTATGGIPELNYSNYSSNPSQLIVNAEVNTVSFGGGGAMQDITANHWAVYPKMNDSNPPGVENCWYYTCLYDVKDLVKTPIENAIKSAGGTYTFTLGHASTVLDQLRSGYDAVPGGTAAGNYYAFTLYDKNGNPTNDYTGYPLGTPAHELPSGESGYQQRYNASYAGWSLVIIYSSPETLGHQLYLYDIMNPNFTFKESYQSDMDFDGDGVDGGKISGFLVPQPVAGETIAAKITCFVGEGDEDKTGESFKVTGPNGSSANLLDGTGAAWNNVWNSKSVGVTASGVDIDTFYVTWGIPWSSGILESGDTWAKINLPSPNDGITLSYIILSFRSSITSGGVMGYLIR